MALIASGGPSFTGSTLGLVALAIFVVAYLCVVLEDVIHLRKSKPVMIAAAQIHVICGPGGNA